LRRALALKRHEQPPPRFFHSFSEEVLDRLHHPPRPESRPTWSQRLGFGEDWKPLMVGVVMVICLLLALGLVSSWLIKKPEPQLNGAAPEDQVYTPGGGGEADAVPPGFTPVEDGQGDATGIQPVMAPEG
jgi:hypothetical protein